MKTYPYTSREIDDQKKLGTWLLIGGIALLVIGGALWAVTEADWALCPAILGPLMALGAIKPLTGIRRYKKLLPAKVQIDEDGIAITGSANPEVNQRTRWDDVTAANLYRAKPGQVSLRTQATLAIIYGTTNLSEVGALEYLILQTKAGKAVIVWDRFVGWSAILEQVREQLAARGMEIGHGESAE